ncbi:MAG: metal-dependent hydrolase [Candidatus Micrarchaeia archaeon]
MARFWTHVAAGVAAFLCVNYYLYGAAIGANSAVLLAAALLGSIIPDADERHTRQFKLIVIVVSAIAFVYAYNATGADGAGSVAWGLGAAIVAGLVVLILKPKHRGMVHSLPAAAVFCMIVLLLRGPDAAAAGLLGFLSHLALDAIS